MIKITSVDQLRVGDIIKEIGTTCYYLLEVYAEGGVLNDVQCFTALLIYCSDERETNVGGRNILYPNPAWFGPHNREEFYVINR